MSSYISYTEAQLLQLLKAGDEAAFTEVYRRYWQQVYAVGFHFSRSKELSEDCVQLVFLSLWDRRDVLNISGSLGGYLATAVKYKVLDQQLQQTRRASLLLHVPQEQVEHGADRTLDAKILAEYLNGVIECLPEKTRIIYRFRKEQDLPVDKIAETLDISPKTVESHITRALKTIRLSLREIRLWLFIF